MLEELRKIRELLEPKPAPPPLPAVKKTFGQEFMDFLNKYGVIGLAVAFIPGFTFFTPEPTASIVALYSCPWTTGYFVNGCLPCHT